MGGWRALSLSAMLASGAHPWTVMRAENRDDCRAAFESASIGMQPFAPFVAEWVEQ
jgi:hypothetical protein